MNYRKYALPILFAVAAGIIVCVFYYGYRKKAIEAETIVAMTGVRTESAVEEDSPLDLIHVHVVGEVKNPGLYDLPSGSRVEDAVNIAGGLTEEADPNVNLAKTIKDGSQVNVPAAKQKKPSNAENEPSQTQEPVDFDNLLININTAEKEELVKLPGVGEVTAMNIIKYREKNGNFKKIEDIKKVTRIGDKTFEELKDFIVVDIEGE